MLVQQTLFNSTMAVLNLILRSRFHFENKRIKKRDNKVGTVMSWHTVESISIQS